MLLSKALSSSEDMNVQPLRISETALIVTATFSRLAVVGSVCRLDSVSIPVLLPVCMTALVGVYRISFRLVGSIGSVSARDRTRVHRDVKSFPLDFDETRERERLRRVLLNVLVTAKVADFDATHSAERRSG